MSELPKIPPLDTSLIEALDKRFPERSPDPDWSDRKIWIEVGKREVIRFLLAEFKKQSNNILEVKR